MFNDFPEMQVIQIYVYIPHGNVSCHQYTEILRVTNRNE